VNYTCPASSPVVIGFAGFNGTGTSYCADTTFPNETDLMAPVLDSTIAGILPKCASLANPDCAYKYPSTENKCFWWYGGVGEDFRCPEGHYVNGVKGFIGNCGATGSDVCVQVRCCSITPTDHSRQQVGSGDEDCDGLVNEGYYTPGATQDVAERTCTGGDNIVCELNNVAKSNASFCQFEGAYFLRATSTGGVSSAVATPDAPLYLFTVNYDKDADACKCRFGDKAWNTTISDWANTTHPGCCENQWGTNASEQEFIIQGRLDNNSFSCCRALDNGATDPEKNLKWVSIDGKCRLPDLYWTGMSRNRLSNSSVMDAVYLVVDNVELASGTEVLMEVYEDATGFNKEIRVGNNSLVGRVNASHSLVANWSIGEADMISAGETTPGSGRADFYYKIKGCVVDNQPGCVDLVDKTSPILDTSNAPDDEPFELYIISPKCGQDYDKGSNVTIIINASDSDDAIFGNLTIGGVSMPFSNGLLTISHNFSTAGNIQVSAFGRNTRNFVRRTISSIMIVDTNTDGSYLAACIDRPADFSDISTSSVKFEAISSRGLKYTAATHTRQNVSKAELNFYWEFSDDSQNSHISGADSLSYDFWKSFQEAGHNWASLRLEYA